MHAPSVEIQFGGKTRHLIFDFNATAELQDVAGTYKSDVAHMKAVRAFLWAGLLAETLDERGRETDKTLSILDVGNILADMSKDEIDALMEGVTKARVLAEPEQADPTKAPVTP
jgi:hypothetical protein